MGNIYIPPDSGGPGGGGAALSAGTQSVSTGTVVFANSNNITFGMSGSNQITASFNETQTVAPIATAVKEIQSAGSTGTITRFAPEDHAHAGLNLFQISGNTANTSNIVQGSIYLAGGNNITLSQVSAVGKATVTISAANQTAQTQNLHNVTLSGNTAGVMAQVSSGTMTLAGGNNITLSQNGNAITISGPNTVAQSVESQSIGMSNLGNTSGTTGIASGGQVRFVFAGGDNITLSQSLNGASGTITISGGAGGAGGGFTGGVSNLGNTSGDTGVVGSRVVFVGGNNITLSQSTNGQSATITISGVSGNNSENNIQDVSPFRSAGTQSSLFAYADHLHPGLVKAGISTQGNTSGSSGLNYGNLVFAGVNNITLSASTVEDDGVTISISGPTIAAQSAESQSIGISNLGNTSGTTGIASGAQVRYLFAGGNNVTLSQSINGASGTVTISAFNQTAGSQTLGISNLGNTSGTTGVVSGDQVRYLFVGGNNITLSQSLNGASGTVTISAGDGAGGGAFSAGISTQGNTSGTTGFVGSQIQFVGTNGITLSQSVNGNSATLTVSGAPAITGNQFYNLTGSRAAMQASNGMVAFQPFYMPFHMTCSTVGFDLSIGQVSNSTAGISYAMGIYTLTGSTLSLVTGSSYSSTSSWTSGSGASNDWGGVRSLRHWTAAQTWSFTPGYYWMGNWVRSTNAGTYSWFGVLANQLVGVQGAVSNATKGHSLGLGYDQVSTATPFKASVAISAITGGGAAQVHTPFFYLVNTTV
jgi:hypothetical protein